MTPPQTKVANIQIRLDNSTFNDSGELPRILRELASRIEEDGAPKKGDSIPLLDRSGHRVGFYIVIEGI